MRLSHKTITVLNHLSQVTRSLAVMPPGNIIAARSLAVLAEATVEENFPLDFRLPDVHEFLRLVRLCQAPALTFNAEGVVIADTELAAEAIYTVENQRPGSYQPINVKRKEIPADHIAFTLSLLQWRALKKAMGAAAMNHRQLVITSDGATVTVSVYVGFRTERLEFTVRPNVTTPSQRCRVVHDVDDIRVAAGEYNIVVTPTYSRFTNVTIGGLRYYVASDARRSSWGGLQAYQIQATRHEAKMCQVIVQAESAEHAERLARGMPVEELTWESAPEQEIEYTVTP